MTSTAGASVSAATSDDEDADRGGHAEALEVRQPGEVQAEHRAGDGQPRAEDDVRRAAIHVVVGGLAVYAGVARFVIAAEQEDRVVGAGRDDQQREEVGRIRRQTDDSGVRQERDDAAGGGQLDRAP